MVTKAIQHCVRLADSAIAAAYLACFRERNALLCFLFHSLFRDEQEIGRNLVDPLERTTVSQLRQLIEYYLGHGYRFVAPSDLLNGNGLADGKYAMLTFDDGYFNNTLALPVLEEYAVPATFFISTEHVLRNKCFWWDVLYRERLAEGATARELYDEALRMKRLRSEEIEARLESRFGAHAFKPRGDVDRPFSPDELRKFARSRYVQLGNHTANHAILTNYTPAEVRDQVEAAQRSLRELTGVTPCAIAYPNGAHDRGIERECADAGLKIGFSTRPTKIRLPVDSRLFDVLRLGRFVPHAGSAFARQCRTYRSDVSLYSLFRDVYLFFARRSRYDSTVSARAERVPSVERSCSTR